MKTKSVLFFQPYRRNIIKSKKCNLKLAISRAELHLCINKLFMMFVHVLSYCSETFFLSLIFFIYLPQK